MNNLCRSSIACAVLLSPFAVHADASWNVGLVSDYRYNGVSQSEGRAALQAGAGYGFDNGFYAGVWGSNARYNDDSVMEADVYGGDMFPLSSSLTADVGYGRYHYLFSDDVGALNYDEYYAGVTLGTSTSLYYYYTDDYLGMDLAQNIYKLTHTRALGDYVLRLSVAQTEVNRRGFYGDEKDYQYGDVSVSRNFSGTQLTLGVMATTLDEDDRDYADSVVYLGVSQALPAFR